MKKANLREKPIAVLFAGNWSEFSSVPKQFIGELKEYLLRIGDQQEIVIFESLNELADSPTIVNKNLVCSQALDNVHDLHIALGTLSSMGIEDVFVLGSVIRSIMDGRYVDSIESSCTLINFSDKEMKNLFKSALPSMFNLPDLNKAH